jgi:ketosteroid isomerase-like protein
LGVAPISAAAGASVGPGVRAQVERVDRAYHRAVARRDLSAVMRLYAGNAYLVPSTSPPLHGRPAIRRYLQSTFDLGWCSFTFVPSAIQARGALVVAFGHYRSALCIGHKVLTGPWRWAVLMFSHVPGGLRISHDIFIG